MEIEIRQEGKITVLVFKGSVDSTTVHQLSEQIEGQINQGKHLLAADMSEVPYINSAGLRIFLVTLKEVRNFSGDFRLGGLQQNVRMAIEMVGFDTLFKIYPDLHSAAASYAG